MMYIGICEDETVQLLFLKREIERYGQKTGQEIRVESFESAEELLFKYERDLPFDGLLLDIKMKQMNGMELAVNIRRRDSRIPIIFVTGDRDAVFDGYKVGAVRYLLKPISRKDFFEALDCLRQPDGFGTGEDRRNAKEDFFCFSYAGDYTRLDKSDILYIEVRGHYITMYACPNGKEAEYTFKGTLGGMKKQLGDERFVQINRSLLANLEHVELITRTECILSGDRKLPVSRSCYEGLNRAFISFYQ